MKDMMIDLEALGKHTNGVIVQLGAVYFDRDTGETGNELSHSIRIDDCLAKRLEVDGDTIKWWINQSKEAQRIVFKNAKDLCWVLTKFREFYKKGTKLWCHEPFDICHLLSAYEAIGEKPPFVWWDARDITTLQDVSSAVPSEPKRVGVAHNAIDDCKTQIKLVVDNLKGLVQVVRDVIEKYEIVCSDGTGYEYLSKDLADEKLEALRKTAIKPVKYSRIIWIYINGEWIKKKVEVIWDAKKN